MKIKDIFPLIFIATLYLLSITMVFTVAQYFSFENNIGFLNYKQSLVDNKFWLTTFYIHVFTCIICLLAGLTQFSKTILQKNPTLHRFLGRVYFYNIIFINFPAGVILAIYANGHFPGKLAFLMLALLWFYFTLSAVISIRNGNIEKHRVQMMRSYSMTLTALTLRILKTFTSKYSGWTYDQIYVFDAWTALLVNLILVELVIYFTIYRSKRKFIISK